MIDAVIRTDLIISWILCLEYLKIPSFYFYFSRVIYKLIVNAVFDILKYIWNFADPKILEWGNLRERDKMPEQS